MQVIESINKCDVDIRRELFSSILVKSSFFLLISVCGIVPVDILFTYCSGLLY